MFDFHEKRKIRSILYSKVTVFILFVFMVFLSVSVYNRYTVAEEMGRKLEVKESELEMLQERAAALDAKVKYLEDDRGIEEELRNRFDVVREGEQTVILIDSPHEEENQRTSGLRDDSISTTESEKSFIESLKFWRSEN